MRIILLLTTAFALAFPVVGFGSEITPSVSQEDPREILEGLLGAPSTERGRTPAFHQNQSPDRQHQTPERGSSYCCRICTTGKACGNSCISRSKTCRKGPGCACDGYRRRQ